MRRKRRNHSASFKAKVAVAAARRFRHFLNGRFAPSRIEVEVPLLHDLGDGRSMRGFVDLLAETPAGWLIVDHKSSPRRKSAWCDEALQHAGQLEATMMRWWRPAAT